MSELKIACSVGALLVLSVLGIYHAFRDPVATDYKIGDCFTLSGDYTYQVTQVGKYSLKTIRPVYNGFEDYLITSKDIGNSRRVDCFDLFEAKPPKDNS